MSDQVTEGEEVAVVKPHYRIEEAYNMGYNVFENMDDSENDLELHIFKEGSRWINTISVDLRSMAGFGDSSSGSFQEVRAVVAINPGCEEDEPAMGELTNSEQVYDILVEAFDMGAHDAYNRNERAAPDTEELW